MVKQTDLLRENLRISIDSIKSNLLRSILTILIIAVGIMALVGILTAIDAIKYSISTEFLRMGANTFSIESREMQFHFGGERRRTKNFSNITFRQAQRFKKEFNFPAISSIAVWGTGNTTVKYESVKTDPNVAVKGVDENFLLTGGYEIEKGRSFTEQEILNSRSLAIIGSEIESKLFKKQVDPINKIITIGGTRYRIIGVLKSKGSAMGFSDDRACMLPVTNVRQYFSRPNMSFRISVMPLDPKLLDVAIGEAEGHFRIIRRLAATDETDFTLNKSDNLAQMLLENLKYVTIAATIIGIITLIGAAIGLMNIMLVSVAERTREIGTRKAIGAKSAIIKQQFLFEAILIGQLGGILGIVLGIGMGNLVALSIGTSFIVPWIWIIGGVLLCAGVSLASGIIPAIKASKLDPIEALRYE
ncbi:MAG: ABC transporter permease [Bacteroidales bacterium]